MHRMIYVEIYARRTYMPMSLNETEHTYIIMARLHIMIYMWCYAWYTRMLVIYIYIYIVAVGMHRMIYVEIYARHTYMPMSLN
jgi:hypothetical protein